MKANALPITARKRIALVAHDNKKKDLLEWARYNRDLLAKRGLCATGTTGTLLELALDTKIEKLRSGPLGGDQQIGARSPRARSTSSTSCSSGTHWSRSRTDPDVKALLHWPSSGTSRWPATGRRRTS